MSDLKRVTALLEDTDVERRVAAAVVCAALELKDPKTLAALTKMLEASPDEQRVALDAFARLAPQKGMERAFAALAAGTPNVREAAHRVLKACGPDIVATVRTRREKANPVEQRELDRVLAELGGKDAFKALLDGLEAADERTAHAAVVSVRERVLSADKRTRASYASATLKSFQKPVQKDAEPRTPQFEAALIKILGWCEDADALPLFIEVLNDFARHTSVRQEAAIALRGLLTTPGTKEKADKKVVAALLKAAESGDGGLARTACDTLAGVQLDDAASVQLKALALHPNDDRARFAIEKLRTHGGAKAAGTLVEVVALARRHIAVDARDALAALPEGIEPAITFVLESNDPDRARLLAELLVQRKDKLTPAQKRKIMDALLARLADDGRGYDAPLLISRAVDANKTAESLRELAAKLKKSKKDERAAHVLILLSNTDGATDDDRLRLALLALKKSRLDARPEARSRDEAIKLFSELSGTVDVVKELKRDKATTVEQIFYLGFHFAEEGDPIAEDLLQEVIARGPRTKLAKAAKNKLALEDNG